MTAKRVPESRKVSARPYTNLALKNTEQCGPRAVRRFGDALVVKSRPMWTISLPLRVPISKKKFFSLNLNLYRNAHYQTLDRAKKNFHEIARELIRGIPHLEACSLEYVLYPATRQLCDVSNVCSIADKFFSDVLVSQGVILDDNYQVISSVDFRFGAVDKLNPRIDVTIRQRDLLVTVPPEIVKED